MECTPYHGCHWDTKKMLQLSSLVLMPILKNLLAFGLKLPKVKNHFILYYFLTCFSHSFIIFYCLYLLFLLLSLFFRDFKHFCRRNNQFHHRSRRLFTSSVGRLRRSANYRTRIFFQSSTA